MKKFLIALAILFLIFSNVRLFGGAGEQEQLVAAKAKVNHMLDVLKSHSYAGQIALNKTRALISMELALVDALLDGVMPARVASMLKQRDRRMQKAFPFARILAHRMINVATMQATHEEAIRVAMNNKKMKLDKALSSSHKEDFLLHMADVLDQYVATIEAMERALVQRI